MMKYQNLEDLGPLPEGNYSLDLTLNPNRIAEHYEVSGETKRGFGIQKLPSNYINSKGYYIDYSNWGNTKARLTMISGNSYGRDNFYIHNSTKGYSHGCLEVGSGFFPKLIEYAQHYNTIILKVQYPSSNSPTLGNTWKPKKN